MNRRTSTPKTDAQSHGNIPFYAGYQDWYNSFIERSVRSSLIQILFSAVFIFLSIFQFYSLSTSYLSPPRKEKCWKKVCVFYLFTDSVTIMTVFSTSQFKPVFCVFHDDLLNFEHHITSWTQKPIVYVKMRVSLSFSYFFMPNSVVVLELFIFRIYFLRKCVQYYLLAKNDFSVGLVDFLKWIYDLFLLETGTFIFYLIFRFVSSYSCKVL